MKPNGRRGTTERYVFEIDRCRGVEDEAMTFMLEAWVKETSELKEWPGLQWLLDLQEFYPVSMQEYYAMRSSVCRALGYTGLYQHLWTNPAMLKYVQCDVKRGTAKLVLRWE